MSWWVYDGFLDALLFRDETLVRANIPYLWLARAMIVGAFAFLVWGVWYAWRKNPKSFEKTDDEAQQS